MKTFLIFITTWLVLTGVRLFWGTAIEFFIECTAFAFGVGFLLGAGMCERHHAAATARQGRAA
ncbi:hypothetical protein LH128_00135 [Sphingomonas sp. LH128]|uniref:hypothetical protein n=1 Tax=Sphingomonas sp. LH128 TaxID=473781 RepID=UPI00027CB146|nr:hypothetical protein [Sphingomonas sp. LH128]EJU15144.1 hypothetical protein LH128_00135 [Sphingomonas sp. LH128]